MARSLIQLVWVVLVSAFLQAEVLSAPDPSTVPETLEAALVALDELLPASEKLKFKSTSESHAVGSAHFGIGMWIRNEWGLWRGSQLARHFLAMGIDHPDDMSGIILRTFWRRLNDKPLEVESQISCYRRYWEEYVRLEEEAKDRGATSYKLPDFDC